MSQPATQTTVLLDQLIADLRHVQQTVTQRFRPLTDQQLNRRPAPSKWSVGQCLEHLNIIGGYYLPALTHKIQQAQSRHSTPAATVKRGVVGRRLTDAMRSPVSEKTYRSPQKYAPSGSRLPRTVVDVFRRQLDDLIHLVEEGRRINLNTVRVANPVIPLLRLRATDVLEMLTVHIQRHMVQAERVLDGQETKGAGAASAAE